MDEILLLRYHKLALHNIDEVVFVSKDELIFKGITLEENRYCWRYDNSLFLRKNRFLHIESTPLSVEKHMILVVYETIV